MPTLSIITMLSLPCVASFLRAIYIFIVFTSIFLVPLVAAIPRPISPSSLGKAANASTSDLSQTVAFAVPCPGCFHGAADAALSFELVHAINTSQCDNVSLTLNGQPFVVDFREDSTPTVVQIPASDRTAELTVQGYCDQNQSQAIATSRQVLFFDINLLGGNAEDNPPSFTVLLDASLRQAIVLPHPSPETQCLSLPNEHEVTSALFPNDNGQALEFNNYESDPTDTQEESHDRENFQATELRRRFNEERTLIRRLTMDCRKDFLDDLKNCEHDLKCSSNAICTHFHDAVARLMANIKSSLQQSPLVSDERQWQAIVADDKSHDYGSAAPSASVSSDDESSRTKRVIILTLEILAGVFGITGLLGFIRRHCRSFRRRAERLADREERKRAREYRRLARKEAFRKKWISFKGVFTLPCRKGNCDEKASLVLEAAAHANEGPISTVDLEQVWNAASQEERNYLLSLAESSIVRRARKHDDARSRSSSLPSYESEKLPAYASQPGSDVVVVDGFRVYSPSLAASSANTAITPDSSVPDLNPRCSGETLRTLMSRD